MVNFVTVGSCLSAMPGIFLMGEYKWKRVNCLKVDRSDLLLADFIDRTNDMPPREEILGFARPMPEHEKYFLDILGECYPETIGLYGCDAQCVPLRDNLESGNIDVIVMDNMVETYAHSLVLDSPTGRRFASALPFHLCQNKDEILARNLQITAPLDAPAAVENWKRIIAFFRAAVPRADLVFACSPYGLSGDDLDRYRRSRDFYLLFKDAAAALGVRLIPPLDVDPRYTKLPDDTSHFDNVIYKAMAGHIVMCHLAALPGIAQPHRLPDHVLWK